MKKIALAKGGPGVILSVCWASEKNFVTVGPKNYQYWTLEGKSLKAKKGSLITAKADQKIVCCMYDPILK